MGARAPAAGHDTGRALGVLPETARAPEPLLTRGPGPGARASSRNQGRVGAQGRNRTTDTGIFRADTRTRNPRVFAQVRVQSAPRSRRTPRTCRVGRAAGSSRVESYRRAAWARG